MWSEFYGPFSFRQYFNALWCPIFVFGKFSCVQQRSNHKCNANRVFELMTNWIFNCEKRSVCGVCVRSNSRFESDAVSFGDDLPLSIITFRYVMFCYNYFRVVCISFCFVSCRIDTSVKWPFMRELQEDMTSNVCVTVSFNKCSTKIKLRGDFSLGRSRLQFFSSFFSKN